MEAVLLVIHLIIALGIIVVVLIQPSEAGGFLGNSGSMSNMMAPRRSADALTRMTGILATAFFVTSLLLAIMAGNRPQEKSIMDELSATPAAATTEETKTDVAPAAETPAAEAPAPQAPIGQ